MLKDGAGGKTTVRNLQYVRHATEAYGNSLQTTVHKLLRLLNRRFLFT
jgi:hypothetical protein